MVSHYQHYQYQYNHQYNHHYNYHYHHYYKMSSKVKEYFLNGNNKYKIKDYNGADNDYTYCIDNADSNDNELANYYSNRAATRLQLGRINDALEDSNSCICVKPTWPKGYTRKGGCLVRLNKLQEAIYAYEKEHGITEGDK